MPPLKNELTNLKRDGAAIGKLLDSHQVISKQQATTLKKFIASLITALNAIADEKVSRQ